jgi:uncharacterized protein YndB with AHSA1/START domain
MSEAAEAKPVLQLNRIIPASRERVFAAWTKPEAVEFTSAGTFTEIRLTHEQLPSIESRDDHGHGWSGTFDKLEKYLVS